MNKALVIIYFMLLLFSSCKKQSGNDVMEENKSSKETVVLKPNSKFLNQSTLIDYVKKANVNQIDFSKLNAPFNELKFDKVIAYDFSGDEETYPNVFNREAKNYNPVVIRQKELSKSQISGLLDFITNSKTYGEGILACFRPHLGIVFYQKNTVVYEIDVCLDCNYLIATTEIPAAKIEKMKLDDGSYIELIGFSKTGRLNIIKMCKELGLDYEKNFR